jgi:hypothetical protein
MNYDKRFFLLWGKVLGTTILVSAAFFGSMYVITQLPPVAALVLVGTFAVGYIGWITFSITEFKRKNEIRDNERVMETLKKDFNT